MFRRRVLKFAGFLVGHAAASVFAAVFAYQSLCAGGPEWLAEGVSYPLFIPAVLLGQFADDPPDLGACVGVPVNSTAWPVLLISVNSLLWVVSAYGLSLTGCWVWRRLPRRCVELPR